MADGSITFSTELDNDALEKELQSVKKKIASLEDSIGQKNAERLPLLEQSKQLGAELDIAKAKLYEMQNASSGAFSTEQINEQQESVKALQTQWNSVQSKVERYDTAINSATMNLSRQKEKACGLNLALVKSSKSANMMAPALAKASTSLNKFKLRLREVIRSALVFTIITQALAKLRNWMGNVIKANKEASAAMSRLKGALLTLAQPIVEVIIPAFTFLVNVLAVFINGISELFARITGKSINQTRKSAESLYEETNAIESAGDAAEKAKKQLAGFDEINQLSDGSTASAGSAGASGTIPDFSGDSEWLKSMTNEAAGMVTAALLLGGIFFIVAGICTKSIKMVIGGALLLGAGIAFGVESGTFQKWWDVLCLPQVSEWIVPALLLLGIGLLVFGIVFVNLTMMAAGVALIGASVVIGSENGGLKNWWDVLCLPQVAEWVTAALLLCGMGLVVFGIF